MKGTIIGAGCKLEKAIIAENTVIGNNVELGVGEEAVNTRFPKIYTDGLVTIGENTVVPDDVKVGKNTAIIGETDAADYPDGLLKSGESIIKAGDLS